LRRATAAALKLSGGNGEQVSTGNELLADIQDIFQSKQVDRIKSADLITALVDDEEKSWATYYRDKPLTPRQLSKLLAPYGIKSRSVRFGGRSPKGYKASWFADAFARYLPDPGNLPQRRNDLPDSNDGMAECVADAKTVAATPVTEETQEPVTSLDCGGVADVSGDAGGTGAGHMLPLIEPEDDF
jgi:putative DNA primase/helicase